MPIENYILPTSELIKSENHTLYAVWGYNPIVTFDSNGGEIEITNKTIDYNGEYGNLPTPTKDGYTFIGWSDNSYLTKIYNLPSEYQQVEYIESNGNQYIDTGVSAGNTKGVYAKLLSSNISSDLVYFGSKQGSGDSRFWVGNKNKQIYYGWNDVLYRSGNSINENEVYDIKMNYLNDRKKIFNDELVNDIGTTELSSSNTLPIYIFAGNNNGASYKSRIRLYNLKISNNYEITNNFVPCYRKNDNVIGLLDTVSGIFYTNKGSGTFGKGSKVTALLTGRGNNTLKDKNILDICGHPVLYYPANAAIKCQSIDNYYCSSDDEKILSIAEEIGYKRIERPKKFSEPTSQHVDVIKHAIEVILKKIKMLLID